MRVAGWLLLLMVLVAWICTEIPTTRTPPELSIADDGQWRRTAEGWQRSAQWDRRPGSPPVRLHPITVGVFQALASIAALLAWPGGMATFPRVIRDFRTEGRQNRH